MATPRRRPPGTLLVYLREHRSGELTWWAAVPGVGRRALHIPEADADKPEAYRIACERYAQGDFAAGGARDEAEEATLREVAKRYLTEEGPRWKPRSLGSFRGLLVSFHESMSEEGIEYASLVTSAALSSYIEERQEHVEDATINRTLMAVRRMVCWGRKRSPPLIPAPVYLESIRPLKEVGRIASPLIPSPAEWALVVHELATEAYVDGLPRTPHALATHAANARGIALLVATAVQTGLRIDELRHLRPEDVGADEVRVKAWGGWSPKSRRERVIPVPASTAALARELAVWREGARGIRGGGAGGRLVLGSHWINERLDAAWSRAKVGGDAPRMHDCRRTFATELVRHGQPLTIVRDRMGHADVETTERYLGRYRSDRDRVVPDMGVGASLAAAGGAVVIPMRRTR